MPWSLRGLVDGRISTSDIEHLTGQSSNFAQLSILTWRGSKSDQRGVSSRARLFHCTQIGLTPAITANVGNSTVQFLVVGACVRARPLHDTKLNCQVKKSQSVRACLPALASNPEISSHVNEYGKHIHMTFQAQKYYGKKGGTKSLRHREFPGGPPSKYYPGPTMLNFRDQTRTGVFIVEWS